MAKVSLRIYNREIEGLIEQGRTDEAIAHCHHILKTFPKYLETYRLLGKSYLEAKRYNDAVDIFGRVLMSVPDDFVAHVGMSIIRDEENKLDDSIWHMERAFEAQPSNAAIQGELQRLYGRRDGMEPPKIRMTRGALAHMYVQGELFPQAVAEIRAVLAQDPQRGDMQVLLALSYFKSGQKSDASDMCAQLLKRYPFSLDANRIMVELQPSSAAGSAAEITQVYRMRVGELDPYATFAKGSVFQSNEVADAAVNLDRLEYKGDEVPMGQEWGSSLGIGLEASSAPMLGAVSSSDQPDWLKSGGFFSTESPAAPAPSSESTNEIPDFLRAAGWGESNTPERPTSIFDEESAKGDLAPAELPDWLKGQVPSAANPPTKPLPDHAQTIATPDWLTGLGEEQSSEPAQPGNVPDWLSGLGGAQPTESEPAQPANVPDWLSAADPSKSAEAAQPGEVPDWLSEPDPSQNLEPIQSGTVPDWLNESANSQTSESVDAAQTTDLPDWLGGVDSQDQTLQQPVVSIENLGSTAQEQDDAVAWLESLAAKHGAKPEELVTDPSKRFETPPEWVSQAQNLNQQTPAAETPAQTVESLGSTAQEQDDAVAWLESLAAKHGAKPEELVTDPSKRFDTPPEWVSQAQTLNQQIPAEQPAPLSVESLGSTAQEQDDAVAWLESLAAKHGAKPEELVTDPSKRFETPPEWVSQAQSIGEAQAAATSINEQAPGPSEESDRVENALNIGEQFFAEFETASTAPPASSSMDETGMWLRDLDEKDKQNESSREQPASSSDDIPDWISENVPSTTEQAEEPDLQRSDLPEWLSDAQTPPASGAPSDFEESEDSKQKLDLPNWLSGVDEEYATQDTFGDKGLSNSDLSNWLSGLDDEPGLPFDKLPTPDSILTEPKSNPPVVVNSELPDWLSDVDANDDHEDTEEEDSWKKSIQQELDSVLTDVPAPVSEAEDVPEWLQGMEEKPSEAVAQTDDVDDTPPWLHREKYEAEAPQQPKPTAPSDWHPAAESAPVQQMVPPPVEERKTFVPPPPEPSVQRSVVEKPVQPAAKKKAGLPTKQRQPEAQNVTVALNQAKSELDRGDIPTALEHYGKLIKKGKHLEETIRDLSDSIYRYPVEVGIWQTLGDAYMRANRLKEALEAYNKAEELIR